MGTEIQAAHNEALKRIRLAHKTGAVELSLNGLALERLPEELSELTTLTTLRVDGCLQLKDISAVRLCTHLAVVDLRACPQVVDLSPLWGLHTLRELRVGVRHWQAVSRSEEPLSAFGDIGVLTNLSELVTLTLEGCDSVSDFQPLVQLTALQYLDLYGCQQLQDLQPLAELTALESLNLKGCQQVQDLQPLAELTALQNLNLSGCSGFQNLQPLAALTSLHSLYLRGCRQIQDLQPLAELTALQNLSLAWCTQLQDLQPLAFLTALRSLDLEWCAQLEDLQPAAKLTALQELDLGRCKQLKDLQPLAELTALKRLNLSECRQFQDLQPVAELTALQNLDLSECRYLQDLQPLANLTALEWLGLGGCSKLKDLQPLAAVTALLSLNLRACEQLQDLQPLAGLTALHSLDLRGCKQLQDLQPLAALTSLHSLNLRGCRQIQDLHPLANLTALQNVNLSGCSGFQDLQPLANLTALQSVDLSYCNQLQDLQPLAALTALQNLNLGSCKQLQDLQPLAELTGLKEVTLCDASWLDCSPDAQPLASWRELEKLYANRLIAAPTELGSRNNLFDNALARIRGWQQDLAAGEAPNSTVKLFVLGNGQVGKTQICRRLCGERFDPSILSTHGIRLGQLPLAEATEEFPAVKAHFWDFGGQDIYLGTHALFLDERAIYVIAWTPQHENSTESEQDDALERNRPLIYWLEYVRSLAGPKAPVIVVQAQCDRELDVVPAPLSAEHGFERLRITSSSAKQDDGMEQLQQELKRAARYQLERYGKVRLPVSWVAVAEDLRVRIDQKTLPRAEFDELCRAKHGSVVPGVVLDYLHRSGQVFWREGLFDNRVVLDLAWALDGVYAVFERNSALPEIRRQAGRFSPQLLGALVWHDYAKTERDLFLSLMEQCQICFKVAKDIFIAPDLLPVPATMESDMQAVWREACPDAVVRLDYAFLHEGVLRAMLCGIGEKGGARAVYWAYGVCFYDAKAKSTMRICSDLPDVAAGQTAGSITVEVAGPEATRLATHLVESIQRINMGRPPELTWETGKAGQEPRTEAETTDHSERAFDAVNPASPPRLAGEAQPVYVSYAWGGESEELVNEFEERMPADFKLIRDKSAMRAGDWISRFMADIGRADLVLVVFSEKYLRSKYCMRELLHLFNASLGKREVFMRKLVPLRVGNVAISDAPDRIEYIIYWKQRHEMLDAKLADLDHTSVGNADRDELLMMKDFQHRISDMLAWVGDTLMPQGTELNTKGIDAAINLLQQRALDLGDCVDYRSDPRTER